MRLMIGAAMGMVLIGTGCGVAIVGAGPAVVGSGVAKQEDRKVGAFTGVDVSSAIEATVSIGAEASVSVEADDNLLPLIRAEARDGRLVVGFAEGQSIRTRSKLKLKVVATKLDYLGARGASRIQAVVAPTPALRLEVDGAGSLDVRDVASDSVEVHASGASRVTLRGSGKRLKIEAEGASSVRSGEAKFVAARVVVEGASKAEVFASESVEGDLSGASTLKVTGTPKERKVQASGASRVSY